MGTMYGHMHCWHAGPHSPHWATRSDHLRCPSPPYPQRRVAAPHTRATAGSHLPCCRCSAHRRLLLHATHHGCGHRLLRVCSHTPPCLTTPAATRTHPLALCTMGHRPRAHAITEVDCTTDVAVQPAATMLTFACMAPAPAQHDIDNLAIQSQAVNTAQQAAMGAPWCCT